MVNLKGICNQFVETSIRWTFFETSCQSFALKLHDSYCGCYHFMIFIEKRKAVQSVFKIKIRYFSERFYVFRADFYSKIYANVGLKLGGIRT